jgi:hypothetical protein
MFGVLCNSRVNLKRAVADLKKAHLYKATLPLEFSAFTLTPPEFSRRKVQNPFCFCPSPPFSSPFTALSRVKMFIAVVAVFVLHSVSCQAQQQPAAGGFSGKGELIYRADFDGLTRYEANLFGGKLTDDRGEPLLLASGGVGGVAASDDARDFNYVGGVIKIPRANGSTLLFNHDNDLRRETDYQGRVNIVDTVSVSGGYTRNKLANLQDSNFYTLWYRPKIAELSKDDPVTLLMRGGYIDWEGSASGEGSLMVSNSVASIGGNFNKEQWRAGIGVGVPKGPSAEVLLFDTSIGAPGPKAFMVNLALRSSHPFFSNVARESRILGVDSVSFENPILRGSTFLDPYAFTNYNRLQFLQDIGDGVALRARGFQLPNDSELFFSELVAYPFQLVEGDYSEFSKSFFVGPCFDATKDVPGRDSSSFGVLTGLRAITFYEQNSLNIAYRNAGLFEGSNGQVQDFLVYLSSKF